MRKHWRFAALALGVVVGVGLFLWVMRLWWLSWLIRLALQDYPIDKLRYEQATWEGRTIRFSGMSLMRGRWTAHIDTLTLRLRWRPCLYIHRVRWEKAVAQPTALSTEGSLSVQPWKLLEKLLRAAAQRLDTLIVQRLEGGPLTCQIRKTTAEWHIYVLWDSLSFPIKMLEEAGGYRITLEPASWKTPRYELGWSAAQGRFHFRRDSFQAEIAFAGLGGYHPRLATERLAYDSVGLELRAHLDWPHWAVQVRPQALPLKMTLTLEGVGRDSFRVTLQVPSQSMDAYIGAFPRGFLSVLSQAQFSGTSALNLVFIYNLQRSDTLDLQIDWQTQGFRIVHWPGKNPLLLREDFVHRPWRSSRTIWLSPQNPDYLSYHQIHPYVLFAILHSEDGGFFYHQGFHKAYFLKALLENWRCQCFRRGAGTITMQLVRNLLLSRQKTLARKIEEILLTALIERFRLLSKERILELYLNMAEWGPEVYGLSEASQFYFAKPPYQLSLAEAVFLGLLLPSPRQYRYYVDDSTHCAKNSLESAFRTIGYFVSKANYVPEDSIAHLSPHQACLRGPARRVFLPPDSLAEDE